MNIVIVGAGAMGCLYGGALYQHGQNAVLVDIWQDHMQAINTHGLQVETSQGCNKINIPARYAHQIEEEPDLLIVFTKSFHTENALKDSKRFIGENTFLLTLQNGLGNAEIIQQFVPKARIIQGVTTFPCDLIAPGQIKSPGEGQTKIMSADGVITARLEEIAKIIDEAGFNCKISPQVSIDLWEKVAFNATLNALTAVTQLPVGPVGISTQGQDLAKCVVKEVSETAKKQGIAVNEKRIMDTVSMAFREHKDHLPSMLQDITAKRQTEIEFLNGAIVRAAEKSGVSTPVTKVLYQLIRIKEDSYL